MKTINFLLFDHIGGLNTLLHTLFNKGIVIAPKSRSINDVLDSCIKHQAEVLPTTPTFLRMMLLSGAIPKKIPASLKIITYGTERMDQPTLDELCKLLPNVDFRQTFGMSELGIVRVKSKKRDSLFMKIGGEGVETRIVDKILQIRSSTRMIGYLNAESPFTKDGWYDTKDIVEEEDGFYKVTGRISEVINVGGLKFMASEVERIALNFPNVSLVKAISKNNPITGEHVEILIEPSNFEAFDKTNFLSFMKKIYLLIWYQKELKWVMYQLAIDLKELKMKITNNFLLLPNKSISVSDLLSEDGRTNDEINKTISVTGISHLRYLEEKSFSEFIFDGLKKIKKA